MMDNVPTLVGCVAGIIVIWGVLCAANRMQKSTRIGVRVSCVAQGVAAAAVVLSPFYLGRPPSIGELFFVVSSALIHICSHRREFCFAYRRRRPL